MLYISAATTPAGSTGLASALFRRERARFGATNARERVEGQSDGNKTGLIGKLNSPILHFSYRDVAITLPRSTV